MRWSSPWRSRYRRARAGQTTEPTLQRSPDCRSIRASPQFRRDRRRSHLPDVPKSQAGGASTHHIGTIQRRLSFLTGRAFSFATSFGLSPSTHSQPRTTRAAGFMTDSGCPGLGRTGFPVIRQSCAFLAYSRAVILRPPSRLAAPRPARTRTGRPAHSRAREKAPSSSSR